MHFSVLFSEHHHKDQADNIKAVAYVEPRQALHEGRQNKAEAEQKTAYKSNEPRAAPILDRTEDDHAHRAHTEGNTEGQGRLGGGKTEEIH